MIIDINIASTAHFPGLPRFSTYNSFKLPFFLLLLSLQSVLKNGKVAYVLYSQTGLLNIRQSPPTWACCSFSLSYQLCLLAKGLFVSSTIYLKMLFFFILTYFLVGIFLCSSYKSWLCILLDFV